MNYSTAIFLINDQVRAVKAIYEAEEPLGKPAPRTMFKTFDTTLKVGDLVLVPTNTRHLITVVKIVEVDVEPDLESHTTIQWVIGPVDSSGYEKLLELEGAAVDTIKSAEKTRKRNELKKALMADSEEKLAALPIASINQPAQLLNG